MTNTELLEKISRLEAELAEVKEMAVGLKKKADGGVFKPEVGQEYWSIMSVGGVAEGLWNDNPFNHDRYAIGNCFPTDQAALDTVRVLKLIQKARESQGGFVPDWEDFEQNKYFLYSQAGEICVTPFASWNIAPIFGFWHDESACQKFLHENREEFLWYFTEYRL